MSEPDRIVNQRAAIQALRDFVNTVNATGGIYRYETGELSGCAADPEWLDLAGAYELACEALGEETTSSVPEWMKAEEEETTASACPDCGQTTYIHTPHTCQKPTVTHEPNRS